MKEKSEKPGLKPNIQNSLFHGDCTLKIKRHLLLERKTMTKLASILKSRDITLLTKTLIVKALVFPVVMYSWESWILNMAEH